MSEEALLWFNELIRNTGISYDFGSWSSDPVPFPFWVGEKDEGTNETEDGLQPCSMLMTGTGRGLLELERDKEKIRSLDGVTAILENGSGIVVYYGGSFPVPIDDADMKRIQVNLQIKEWRI